MNFAIGQDDKLEMLIGGLKNKHWQTIPLSLAVILGAFAGGVGGLVASIYLLPPLIPADDSLARRLVVETRPASTSPETISNAVAAAVVRLVPARALPGVPLAGGQTATVFVPEEAVIARAVALTEDGWLVTSAEAAAEIRGAVAVTGDGARYAIETIVTDPGSGAAFLRIPASNLPVVAFGKSDGVRVGDKLLLITGRGEAAEAGVVYRGGAKDALAAAVISSETSSDRIRLSVPLAKRERGSPVIDRYGELVGIAEMVGAPGRAIPSEDIRAVVAGVFRSGEVHRPLLGVRSVDRSLLSGLPEKTDAVGALLLDLSGKTAVARGTPAFDAGLRAGDVILAVEGVALSPGEELFRAIRDYRPGDRIELLIQRGKETWKAVATLGDTAEK